ncbi:hypothetical protein [Nereida ignava]
MKGKMDTLEARKAELDTMLAQAAAEEPIILHPALANVYRGKIKTLASSVDDEATKVEAIELLRSLVAEVRLHPDDDAPDGHVIQLYRELAAILELSGPTNDEPRRITGGVSVIVGCGSSIWTLFSQPTPNTHLSVGGAESGRSPLRGEWAVAMACLPNVAVPAAQSCGDGDVDAS